MDLFYFILAALSLSGVVLLVAPAFLSRKQAAQETDGAEERDALLNYMNLNAKKSEVESSVAEADSVITEIHDVSQSVLKEIDGKYQELLFLYNLIEDKRGEIEDFPSSVPSRPARKTPKPSASVDYLIEDKPSVDLTIGEVKSKLFKHPKLAEIKRLKGEGATNADIARKLGVGQGEIALILELAGKAGV